MTLSQEQSIMEESSYYQGILKKGEAKGEAKGAFKTAHNVLLRLGTKRFGEPDPRVLAAIDQIKDATVLEDLALRAVEVSSWQELLPKK